MRFLNRLGKFKVFGFVVSGLLVSACGGGMESKGDNPVSVTESKRFMCLGQVVALTYVGYEQKVARYGYPTPAWTTPAIGETPLYTPTEFDAAFGMAAKSELCGVPADSTKPLADYITALKSWAGAYCICPPNPAAPDSKVNCDNECERQLDLNPAYKAAPGDYSCDNEPAIYNTKDGLVTPRYAENTGISCDPKKTVTSTQALTQTSGGTTGGLTQFMSVAKFHMNVSDGTLQANGIGVIQYSADVSDNCAGGCEIVINRITMAFDTSKYDRWTFTKTFVDLQEPLFGTVAPNGSISIPASAGRFVLEYTSNDKTGNFVDSNREAISGSFDAATGNITLSTIALRDGDLTADLQLNSATVIAGPPRPNFSPTGVLECNARLGREVQVSSDGSYDPDGDIASYHWVRNDQIVAFGPSTTIFFGMGANEIALNAVDSRGALNYKRGTLEIVDTTPPVWGDAPLVDLTSCDKFVDQHSLTPPPVSDVCTDIATIRARIVKTDGAVRPVPLDIDHRNAVLPGGEHVVEWIAVDGYGNQSSTFQTVRLGPAVVATDVLNIRDRAKVVNQAGALAAVGSTGTQTTQLGVRSQVAEVLSVGRIFLQNDAQVTGRAASKSSIELQNGASVGLLQAYSPVPLGNIPWLAPYAGTTYGSGYLSLEPGTTKTLANGAYGSVSVKSGSTLIISGNDLSFVELGMEPQAKVLFVQPETKLVVRDRFVQRGVWQGSGWVKLVVFGTEARFETPVKGIDVIAPNAQVTVTTGANGTRSRGLIGRNLEIQPDVVLTCDRNSTL